MALIVFDMGRRVETPIRPEQKRVRAAQAISAVRPIERTDAPHAQQASLQAYTDSEERKPDAVAFVNDIMHKNVQTLNPSASLRQAWNLLQTTGFHHLPVVDDQQRILAMFSDHDLLNILAKQTPSQLPAFWSQNIMGIAIKPVLCVLQNTDIRQSSNLLYEYDIGALPVLNDQHELCGIVTRSDILRLLSHYGPMELWA